MEMGPSVHDDESHARGRRGIDRYLNAFGDVLSLSAVLVAAACAIVFRIAVAWMATGIPFGLLIVVVAAVPLLNYFFEIVEHRALGGRGWPVLSWETLVAFRRQLSFAFFFAVIATAMVRFIFVAAGAAVLGDLFALLGVLLLPVAAAVLAVTRRPSKSVNPFFLLRTIVRLESGYVLILVASAAWWILALKAWSAGSLLLLFAATVGLLWLGFLIGSVVYGRRGRLGLRTARSPEAVAEREAEKLRRDRENALGTAWVFASRDNITGAIAHVSDYARQEPDALSAEVWMFHRMARWQYPAAALRFGRELLERLRVAGREHDATKIEVVCEALIRAAGRVPSDS